MLKDIKLLVEFQDLVAKANSYLKNQVIISRLIINGKVTSLEEAFSNKKPNVDYVRVQGYKYYSYVNLSSLLARTCHDKLIPREREVVFIRYNTNITKQYLIYALDIKAIIKVSLVTFKE